MSEDQRNNMDANIEPQDQETVPEHPAVPSEGNSRRNFLRAAVVASAAVVTAGGVAGVALASGKGPDQLLRFANFVASGVCIPLAEGGKFGGSNPNNFLQVLGNPTQYLDSFGTAGPADGTGNFPLTLTRCGTGNPINFTLTDKNHASIQMQGQIVQTGGQGGNHSYKDHTNGKLFLAFTNISGDTDHQYPTGSCLKLSC
jgi:hypothetical protein